MGVRFTRREKLEGARPLELERDGLVVVLLFRLEARAERGPGTECDLLPGLSNGYVQLAVCALEALKCKSARAKERKKVGAKTDACICCCTTTRC